MGQAPVHNQYVSAHPASAAQSPRLPADRGRTKGGEPSLPARQNDSIKGTSDTWAAVRRWQRRRRGMHRKHPYRRVKGRCWGNGLGSLVTCRHRLLASRRHAMAGLHTPVPGESSRAVMPPDNTAHIFQKGQSGTRAGHISSQNEDTARTGAVLPARLPDERPDAIGNCGFRCSIRRG